MHKKKLVLNLSPDEDMDAMLPSLIISKSFWAYDYNGSWASSFEMMTSPHFNLEMGRRSPLYLEFDYRYSVEDTLWDGTEANGHVTRYASQNNRENADPQIYGEQLAVDTYL